MTIAVTAAAGAALLWLAWLSIVSIVRLAGRKASPYTSAAWLFSLLYAISVFIEVCTRRPFSGWVTYGVLAVMTVAFIIAGVRDEPQAEPWYAPARVGRTRAEKRLG